MRAIFPYVVHQCPPIGSGVMPCCGLTPFQVSKADRMTINPSLVTCAAPSPKEGT